MPRRCAFEEGSGEFTSSIAMKSTNSRCISQRKTFKAQRPKVIDHRIKLMTHLSGRARLQQSDIKQERKAWEPQSTNQKIDISVIRFRQWSSDVNVKDMSGLVDVSNSPMDSPWTFRNPCTSDSWSSARIAYDFEELHLVDGQWQNASIRGIKMSKRKCNFK